MADPGIRVDEFRGGLRELGYVGPRELRIDVRIAQRDAPSVRAAVDELLQLPVALIVAHINAAPLVQRAVAGRAPIVFAFSGDPVEAGLVASYARPGGNTTGMSFMALELVGKRLELIKDMAPRSKRVAILSNPMHPGEKAERQASLSAAEQLGLELSLPSSIRRRASKPRWTRSASSAATPWSSFPTPACWRAPRRSPSSA